MLQMVTPDAQPGIGCRIPPGFPLGPAPVGLTTLCHCKHSCQQPIGYEVSLHHWPAGSRNGRLRETLAERKGVETRPSATAPLPADQSSLHLSPSRHSDFWVQKSIPLSPSSPKPFGSSESVFPYLLSTGRPA